MTILKRVVSPLANAYRTMSGLKYQHLNVTRPADWVAQVELNRPDKRNALNEALWSEVGQVFDALNEDADCRAIVLSGSGKAFCAGIDLNFLMKMGQEWTTGGTDVSRRAFGIRKLGFYLQDSFTALERCQKPVIAMVHGACVGAGINMVAGADIRIATSDTTFAIKEVKLGITADVGILQRVGQVVGNDSFMRELAFTGRDFNADEAMKLGFISRVVPNKEDGVAAAVDLAKEIGSRSPVAVQGTKVQLNYARDHSVADSLEYAITWNAAMIQSDDVMTAATAQLSKDDEPPVFSKL